MPWASWASRDGERTSLATWWTAKHPITPIMIGDAALAGRMADLLLEKGVYAIGFSHPVVPQGKARVRVQVSAAHSREDLEFAIEAFTAVRDELGL